jgi:hypothetical protein
VVVVPLLTAAVVAAVLAPFVAVGFVALVCDVVATAEVWLGCAAWVPVVVAVASPRKDAAVDERAPVVDDNAVDVARLMA